MGDGGAGLGDFCPFAFAEMDRVAHDCTGTNQTKLLVDVQIVAGFGEKLAHPGDFFALLAEMGLHQTSRVFGPKIARRTQLFG